MCEVRIERKFLLPPEEPPVESAPEPIEVTREVDDTFISNYCPHYTDLVNLLSKHFGVTEVEGKGSHVGLTLHGHKYPTSKNMRDGTFPITDRFIRAVLNQLRIREEDFINAVEG